MFKDKHPYFLLLKKILGGKVISAGRPTKGILALTTNILVI
jgi:hypothetical protein